jgi:ABC-type sugar transport system ATPase subunit
MRNLRKFIAVASIAATGVLATGGVASAESASGSGATFPQQFLASATVAYNAKTGHNVTYANPGGGSTTGKSSFKAGLTDFGGTDSAVTATQAATFDWTYIPYVGGAISVAYRLDELKGATLSLSANTVNGIFGGLITNWADASIAADMRANPTWVNGKKKSLETVIPLAAHYGGAQLTDAQARAEAQEWMLFTGLQDKGDHFPDELNLHQRKFLELARALAARPQVLLLDEVLSGLTPAEIGAAVKTIRRIRERGTSIVFVEHVMSAVLALSDRLVVLNQGEVIAEGDPQQVMAREEVVRAYLGDEAMV